MGNYEKRQADIGRQGRRVYPAERSRSNDDGPFGNEGPYKGFLIIKCEHCGAIKAFCAKKDLYGYHCDDCKQVTPLENLRPMYLKCKCGKEYRYKTNITDRTFTHKCITCGAPVDMQINKRETAYVTVKGR